MSSLAIAKSLRKGLALLIAAFALVSAAPALAQPVKTEHVELELIAQGEVVPGQETYVALRQVIEDGWHTYWRNSGDSGEATKIAWTLPAGWKAGDFVWKTPERLPFSILMNYGYSNEVILPVAITAPLTAQPGSTVPIKAQVSFLVCADICIPGSAMLNLDLKIAGAGAPAADPKWSGVIADAIAKAPKAAGLAATTELANGVLKLSVTGDPFKGRDLSRAYFFPFSGGAIDHAKSQTIEKGAEGLTLSMTPSATFKGGPLPGVLTLGDVAYEVDAAVGAPLAGAVGGGVVAAAPLDGKGGDGEIASDLSLPMAALFAFLGGLILNLMPCVFPVLSMKAASLAGHAHEVKAARAQGLAFLAGVLATFLALAALLLAARAAGEAVGWGFQLQSPPVTAGLSILMLLVALNLSGLFEIGTSVQGAGSGLASKSGLAGAFFTGALAVVVAAPCTAPFMAGALGYAVSQPPAISLLVFAALGLGFAAPFTALAFAPALLRRLPRPGPWMSVLKTVLAFPMYGTAAWLAWVFAAQAGQIALGMLLAAAIAIAFAAWLFGQGQRAMSTPWRVGLQLVLPIALIAAVVALAPVAKPQAAVDAAAPAAPGDIPHGPWDQSRIASLQAEGKVVFVDFTADWCVTCKVNEGTALKSKSVADAFEAANAVYMIADWTLRDAKIAAALAEHGRTGVPLYLMYPKGGGKPEILPQLLTEGLVKKALQKAAS